MVRHFITRKLCAYRIVLDKSEKKTKLVVLLLRRQYKENFFFIISNFVRKSQKKWFMVCLFMSLLIHYPYQTVWSGIEYFYNFLKVPVILTSNQSLMIIKLKLELNAPNCMNPVMRMYQVSKHQRIFLTKSNYFGIKV